MSIRDGQRRGRNKRSAWWKWFGVESNWGALRHGARGAMSVRRLRDEWRRRGRKVWDCIRFRAWRRWQEEFHQAHQLGEASGLVEHGSDVELLVIRCLC